MKQEGLPTGDIDDRRNSIVDAILTQLRYPLRKDWVAYQRWGDDPVRFPQIAAEFPPGIVGEPDSVLAHQLGIKDIAP